MRMTASLAASWNLWKPFSARIITVNPGEVLDGAPTASRLLGQLIADATDTARVDGLLAVEGALVLLLARLRSSGRPSRGRGIPSAVAHAVTLIDDDPTAPLTLADLAGAAGLGRFQLVRAFTRSTYLTPQRLPAAAAAPTWRAG